MTGFSFRREDLSILGRAVVERRHGTHVGADDVAVDQDEQRERGPGCELRARLIASSTCALAPGRSAWAQAAGAGRGGGERRVEALGDHELRLVGRHPADEDAGDRHSGGISAGSGSVVVVPVVVVVRNPAAPTFPARTTAASAPAAARASATTSAKPRPLPRPGVVAR